MAKPPRLLVIAGSDSSGGAGIQADIKTACAFGVYAMTAITAVTAQDTAGIHASQAIPAALVREQIICCLQDIGADAIKIGMLASAETASVVADILEGAGLPAVLDPVLASSSGTPLLDRNGIAVLRERLFPLAALLTPNLPELAALADMTVATRTDVIAAAQILRQRAAKAVLAKGGHDDGAIVEDILISEEGIETIAFPRLQTRHTHGTGCTLATAIACGLAAGLSLPMAVRRGRQFLQAAIAAAPGFGRGRGPLNHLMPTAQPNCPDTPR